MIDGFLTVTVNVAETFPSAAVIVALPAFTAVTVPFASTVATFASLDFHVISPVRFVVALRVTAAPL